MERDASNDFTDFEQLDFEQLIYLIRDDHQTSNPLVKFCLNCDCEQISGCLDDTHFGQSNVGEDIDLDNINAASLCSKNLKNSAPLSALPVKHREEENITQEESSGTTDTTTMTMTTKGKQQGGDRSKTLVSERRRRGSMKEKLYALRALVPSITKMDKASIVGDAALYVQELQTQAMKLRSEIAALEVSLAGSDKQNRKNVPSTNRNHRICKKIIQMDMFPVEQRGFYVRVECNRSEGVAVSLYKALESLTILNLQSSNLAIVNEKFVLTSSLKVRDGEPDMHLANLKLWVAGALLNQGFEFQKQPSA